MENKVYYKSDIMKGFERISKEEFDSIPMNWVETSITIDDFKLLVFIKDVLMGRFLDINDEDLINKINEKWYEWWKSTVYSTGIMDAVMEE